MPMARAASTCIPPFLESHTALTAPTNCPPASRYAGDANGKGGIYNFVTKRGLCHGHSSKISWTQVRLDLYLYLYLYFHLHLAGEIAF